ncbi:MAG: protein-disulfide isomerase [Nitrosopumilales archaeon CG15_BIG_FIL_POST_REV_8_21_14_020_37_12]|nr:MAG: protein-disulfide isomerase [Nitrosopumilales archaeon CG15_BIG_FIL_POST_REV_8_21_14_020_37_12]
MGRKERREREEKRDSYASKRSSEKRKQTLIAVGVFSVIAVIVGYSAYTFATMSQTAPGGPENAGPLGSDHAHAAILVKIFGDSFDFSAPAYQIKSSWIHFEGRDGSTIHKHATGVTLGYLFETLGLGLDDQCFRFQDGRNFCTNEDYSLKFYINGEKVDDIRDYEISEDDRILISYGGETQEELESQLLELQAQDIIK